MGKLRTKLTLGHLNLHRTKAAAGASTAAMGRSHIGGTDNDNDNDDGDMASSSSLPEPCSICHNPVGTPTPEDIVEAWSSLPCGHRFGSHCAKSWLGFAVQPSCPVCRKPMVHVCGHPTLPIVLPPESNDGGGGGGNKKSRRRTKKANRGHHDDGHDDNGHATDSDGAGSGSGSSSSSSSGSGSDSDSGRNNHHRFSRRLRAKRALIAVVRTPSNASAKRFKGFRRSTSGGHLSDGSAADADDAEEEPPAAVAGGSSGTSSSASSDPAPAADAAGNAKAERQRRDSASPAPASQTVSAAQPSHSASSSSSSSYPSSSASPSASPSQTPPPKLEDPCIFCHETLLANMPAEEKLGPATLAIARAIGLAMRIFVPSAGSARRTQDVRNAHAALWARWRRAHAESFSLWWAQQMPPTAPARKAVFEVWSNTPPDELAEEA